MKTKIQKISLIVTNPIIKPKNSIAIVRPIFELTLVAVSVQVNLFFIVNFMLVHRLLEFILLFLYIFYFGFGIQSRFDVLHVFGYFGGYFIIRMIIEIPVL